MRRFIHLTADLARRGGFSGGTAVIFTLVTASLFAVALAPAPAVLTAAAPAVIWLALLLAALLTLESLWHRPLATGRFDALFFTGCPAVVAAGAGIVAHWLATGLPLCLGAVVIGPMLGLPAGSLVVVLPSLALGTVYLSLVGSLGALLTFGARGGGLLLAVLILPLMVPMILLGLMAFARWMLVPAGVNPYLLLQAALVVLAVPLLTAATAWLLRTHIAR